MEFPVRILSDSKKSGVRADIFHFENTVSRIYSENLLLCHLKGQLKITFDACEIDVQTCSVLFVPNGQTLLFESPDAYVLCIFISDSALENRQFQIQLDSHTNPMADAYVPILSTLRQFLNPNIHQMPFQNVWKEKVCQDLIYELLSAFCIPDISQQTRNTITMRSSLSNKAIVDFPDTFSNVLKVIDSNYMENIQLKQLAETFYYTPSHLSKLFVHYTGQLFSDYLTQLRLSKALPLLLQTSMEITQISDKCGFPNARSFAQAFQKYYHVRPSLYRKQYDTQIVDTYTDINEQGWDEIKKLGILDAFYKMETFNHKNGMLNKKNAVSSSDAIEASQIYNDIPSTCLQRQVGRVSVAQHGTPTSVAHKNNILNIDFCRDLLMEDLQAQIRHLLKSFDYEYITLNCFLADEMQIYFSDNLNRDFTIKDRGKREITFDFTLYDQLFGFLETTGLKPIIPLSYMPSFLAKNTNSYDPTFHSCKCMPYSMTEWQTYIRTLFAYLKQRYGKLLSQSRIFLWKVPDVITAQQTSISEEEYFELYTCTYQIIRSILPKAAIDSPTISCTNSGFTFMKRFLNHCVQHHCLPDWLLFTYYHTTSTQFNFPSSFLDCTNFFNSVSEYLKNHFSKNHFLLCMLDYNFAFGRNYYLDGLPGAMLPIILTLNQSDAFIALGMERAADYTTRLFFGNTQFSGTLSSITASGGRKATYYSLAFLQALGDELILKKTGCYLTKAQHKIVMLLYYNVPMDEWKHSFKPENIEKFYTDFPDMKFSISLCDLQFKEMILREQSLTFENGSAYETWVKNGWHLVTGADSTKRPKLTELYRFSIEKSCLDEPIYTSFPVISNCRVQATDRDEYTYDCSLKPFEIRLVEFIENDSYINT